MASLWCQPISVPGFLNLDIAIVFLCLRVHYSVEIKHYKSQIKVKLESWIVMMSKYSLEMSTMLKSYNIRVAREAIGNKKLVAQNEPLFDFIPIYVLQLHNELRKDGIYNYRGLQIPILSKLNFQKWGESL